MNDKIIVDNVARYFGSKERVVALQDVNLRVADGEFVCLVGPSGCGKSTLLRMVANLQRPSSGEVRILTDSPRPWPTAMVFQSYGIFPWKTVEQNVAFGLKARGVSKNVARERVERWLLKMGLTEFARKYPHTLSGGMQQRVSIARAMAVEPEILLMDEPFAALDAQLRRVLQEELLRIWQENARTVLFVTHSLDEAILLGDRVVVMSGRPGHIVGDYKIPFPRPRTSEVRGDRAFAALEEQLWGQLSGEVSGASRTTRTTQSIRTKGTSESRTPTDTRWGGGV